MSANRSTKWSARVEQELTCAAQARDVSSRKAHLELAILHLEATSIEVEAPRARDLLSAALFSRIAFVRDH